jgi:hypothetical protein
LLMRPRRRPWWICGASDERGPTNTGENLMQMHFEGSTKSEALAEADAWWGTQTGLTAILRVTRPIDDAEPPTGWKVVVHYQASIVEPVPLG